MTDAPPSSTDEAAVEAMKHMPQETRTFGNEITADRLTFEREGARIITDAYAEQRIHLVQADRTSEALAHSIEVRDSLLARLTAEREVREKLVGALKQRCPQTRINTGCSCDGCTALAAAEKLDEA